MCLYGWNFGLSQHSKITTFCLNDLYSLPLSMKKLLFLLLISPLFAVADDTAYIQSLIDAHLPTLPGHVGAYTISSTINVTYPFDLNGQTVKYTPSTGVAFNVTTSLKNGSILGSSNASNPAGNSGVKYSAANITLDGLTIRNFTAYAIIAGNYNNPTIKNCTINNIGYIGAFIISDSATSGGLFYNNIIDRTDQPASSIQQAAFLLRGAAGDTTSGWIIRKNTFRMPIKPTAISAECMEIRYSKNVLVDSNTFQGGTIANSIVRSNYIVSRKNIYTSQGSEAIEFADTKNSKVDNETISSQYQLGIFMDGFATYGGDDRDSVVNCTISGTASHSISCNSVISNIYIANNTISTNTIAVRIQKANNFTIVNNTITGNGVGTYAVYLDNSTGNITLSCGGISGFINKPLFIYGSTAITTSAVNMTNFTSSTTGYSTYLTGGAAVSGITVTPVVTPVGCTSGLLPNIAYSNQSFTALTTISTVTPTNSGGTASTYAISPSIPAGLSFNPTTGAITGTPTVYQTSTSYSVIATNLIGADTATFTISVAKPAFTFGSLPTKTYGNADFAPGATSPASISYTSSNSSVAVITGGQIHIVGAGTSTITANNTYETIPQTLTVNKAALTVTANNKARVVGKANPPLTVVYSGFVNNEDHTVLTAQPSVSTTANTGSPIGTYPITPASASAANYTISYSNGTLYVFNDLGPLIYNGKLILAY